MARRHISGAVVAGFALAAAGVTVAPPATAAVPTAISAMPSVVQVHASQAKPHTKAANHHKPHKVNRGQLKKHAAQPPVHHAPKKPVAPVTTVPKTASSLHAPRVRPVSRAAAPAVAKQPTTPPADHRPTGVFRQVAGAVDHAVQTVFTIFGWNLLALFPMAAIALVISRRIRSAGLSAARRRVPL